MVMVCESCAASLGPDLAAALRRKTGQLRQFGLAEADGFILEPMIGGPGRANGSASAGAGRDQEGHPGTGEQRDQRHPGTNDR